MGTMTGVQLGAAAITGVKAGVHDSVATMQTTLNNQYLMEGLILFIGLSVGIGVIMFLVKAHRRIGPSGSFALKQNNHDYAVMHAKSYKEFKSLTGGKY